MRRFTCHCQRVNSFSPESDTRGNPTSSFQNLHIYIYTYIHIHIYIYVIYIYMSYICHIYICHIYVIYMSYICHIYVIYVIYIYMSYMSYIYICLGYSYLNVVTKVVRNTSHSVVDLSDLGIHWSNRNPKSLKKCGFTGGSRNIVGYV